MIDCLLSVVTVGHFSRLIGNVRVRRLSVHPRAVKLRSSGSSPRAWADEQEHAGVRRAWRKFHGRRVRFIIGKGGKIIKGVRTEGSARMRERGRGGGEESKGSKEGAGMALMTVCYAFHLSSFHQIPFLFVPEMRRCRSSISFVVFCSNWVGFTGISWSTCNLAIRNHGNIACTAR